MLGKIFWCACALMLIFILPPTGGWMDDLQGGYVWEKAQISMIYASLTAFGTIAYPYRSWMVVVALCLLAMVTELIQSLAPWLRSDLYDILAAFTGITLMRVIWVVAFKR
jgi:hypothetical protein